MTTQICNQCKIEKQLDEFYTRKYSTLAGEKICHSHTCKSCAVAKVVKNTRDHWEDRYKTYHQKFYATGAAIQRCRDCRDRMWLKVNQLKQGPCMDCGRSFPAVCMDFDHRDPSTKSDSISQLVAKRRRWEIIEEEIQKCDLVCACCHRIRSSKMLGWNAGEGTDDG